jgi:hypothetical protein
MPVLIANLLFQDDIVYYSHPFEFELWYKPSPNSADHGKEFFS